MTHFLPLQLLASSFIFYISVNLTSISNCVSGVISALERWQSSLTQWLLLQRPGFGDHLPHVGSQLSVTPLPVDQVSSSALLGT